MQQDPEKYQLLIFKRDVMRTLVLFGCFPLAILLSIEESKLGFYWSVIFALAPGEFLLLAYLSVKLTRRLAIRKFGNIEKAAQKAQAQWILKNKKAAEWRAEATKRGAFLLLISLVFIPLCMELARKYLGIPEIITGTLGLIAVTAANNKIALKKSQGNFIETAAYSEEDNHTSLSECIAALPGTQKDQPPKTFNQTKKILLRASVQAVLFISFIFIPLESINNTVVICLEQKCNAAVFTNIAFMTFNGALSKGIFDVILCIVLMFPSILATAAVWIFFEINKIEGMLSILLTGSFIASFSVKVYTYLGFGIVPGIPLYVLPFAVGLTVMIAYPQLISDPRPEPASLNKKSLLEKGISFALNKTSTLRKAALYTLCVAAFWSVSLVSVIGWFGKATAQGDLWAESRLGFFYANGIGVDRDPAKAYAYWRHGAEAGYAISQYDLGCTYEAGDFVHRDATEAAKWYLKAAKQNHHLAQFYLAKLYETGDGVPQDYAEARKWYAASAALGNQNAQRALESLTGR